MLKPLWDKAVYGYQTILQKCDRMKLEELAQTKSLAQDGFQMVVNAMPAVLGVGYGMERVRITPEQAADIIKKCDENREEILKRTKARRDAYGLRL